MTTRELRRALFDLAEQDTPITLAEVATIMGERDSPNLLTTCRDLIASLNDGGYRCQRTREAVAAMKTAIDGFNAVDPRPDLIAVVTAMIDECEDTYVDPSEMSSEWVGIYNQAKAAIAKANGL